MELWIAIHVVPYAAIDDWDHDQKVKASMYVQSMAILARDKEVLCPPAILQLPYTVVIVVIIVLLTQAVYTYFTLINYLIV